jgi:hypothetical protein
MKINKGLILIGNILLVQFFYAQEQAPVSKKIYTTKALVDHESPAIDGHINEKCWEIVDWSTDFVEREPDENTAPTEQTKFKIIYDKKFLYIAFRCYDKEPSKIVKRMSRRDGFEGDWVEINIDSYHDKRSGFSFTSSVSGVKGDEFI